MIASASFSSSLPSSQIRRGARGLQVPEGMDHRRRHRLVGDGKIVDGAGGRGAVQRVGGHLHLAHRVAFNSMAHRRSVSLQKTNGRPRTQRDSGAAVLASRYNGGRMIPMRARERNGKSD